MAVARERSRIGTKAHGAAKIAVCRALLKPFGAHPFRDQANDRFRGCAEFGGRCVRDPGEVSRRLHAGHLHPEADAEIGNAALAGEANAGDLSLRAALAKGPRHQDGVQRFQSGGNIAVSRLKQLGVYPLDIHLHPIGDAAMHQRLVQRFIGIRQPDIFADNTDRDFAFGVGEAVHDIGPAIQCRRRAGLYAKGAQHFIVQALGMVLRRHIIDAARIKRGDNGLLRDIAEQGDFCPLAVRQRLLAAAHQHIGLHAKRGQLAHAVLGRLGFQLAGGRNEGNKRYVDRHSLPAAQIIPELANSLDERQRFDIAYRSADFAQDEIHIIRFSKRKSLDGIRYVRNHLHGRAQIIAAPLARYDRLINPARRHIVGLPGGDTGKPLIMAKVQIGFGAIVGHIDFAMLIRAHRARIDIQIGIELSNPHGIAARLQQRA